MTTSHGTMRGMQGEGWVSELLLVDGTSAAHIQCAAGLIPSAGQYVMAHAAGSTDPLANALFSLRSFPDGFLAAPPLPSTWLPGVQLRMRGPLGHGFSLPNAARRIGLIAFGCTPQLLLSLVEPALRQSASITLAAEHIPDDLSPEVEAQPLRSLADVCRWADYLAVDIPRELLPELRTIIRAQRLSIKGTGQVLVRTPMPCGALAACGVCTVESRGKALLACDDGPVFDFDQLME